MMHDISIFCLVFDTEGRSGDEVMSYLHRRHKREATESDEDRIGRYANKEAKFNC